jgi:amidase
MISTEDYIYPDGLALAELVKSGEVSAKELAETAIHLIEQHNPALNAVITPLFDMALRRAAEPQTGSFAGVPFLVKDLGATIEGVPTSSGNRLLKSIPAKADSELVKCWKAAGLNIIGKTNTPEFGLTPYTEPETFGPTRNPWDTSRTPGGSSGGSAAAVAARITPLASGNDGGGSIRIPASACGLFGMKPTRGRTPSGTFKGAWQWLAVEHVLTRSVRDSAAMLDATHGAETDASCYTPHFAGSWFEAVAHAPKRLRIAASAKPLLGDSVNTQVLEGFDATVKLLGDLGHEVIEAAPVIERDHFTMAFLTIICAELRADIEETARTAGLKMRVRDFDATSFGLGLFGKAFSATELAEARRYLQAAAQPILAFFEDYDMMLTPVLASPPVEIGSLLPKPAEMAFVRLLSRFDAGWVLKALGLLKPLSRETFSFTPWTPVFNVTGQPAMSVPLHWTSDGLPVGMQFVGRFGDEKTLFSLAGELEGARPWAEKNPPGFGA